MSSIQANYRRSDFFMPNKIIVLVIFACGFIQLLDAQRPHYRINAALDTANHILSGTVEITYTNFSKETLHKLGLHLWPNAYSNRSTALVKQMIQQGNFSLYNASPNDLGGISGLQFSSTSGEVNLTIDPDQIDIAWLQLTEPLAPGSVIHLTSPFNLKIPHSFSRLGRTGASYQLTQWYPHLAVFDEAGWHTMPYLDLGEFFNDFADYEVILQAPSGYQIAGTGVLISQTEKGSNSEWIFKADNVIDFAWFASPTFKHQQFRVDVGGHQDIELNIYIDSPYSELWEKAGLYATRALQFYSDWLGPYPYPQMSVVYTPFSRAGYMEYPMVAQIGITPDTAFLDDVIAHEIGHTWLYGILANNERTHPWMDEGLNSFLERRYMEAYHPEYTEGFLPTALSSKNSMDEMDAFQHALRFSGHLQPPASSPERQISDQYLFSAYILPAQGLEMMMSIKGPDMTRKMFRQYYTDHQFTHVTPADLRQSFETACECDLTWFFEGWLHHAHEMDYRIKKLNTRKKEVTIENHGTALLPVQLTSYRDNQLIRNYWIDGFSGSKIFHLDNRPDELRLYEDAMTINRKWYGSIKPKPIIPRISILPKIASYSEPSLSITPFFGSNIADGFSPGVVIMSDVFPQRSLKFLFAPMFGTESKEIRGYAEMRHISEIKKGPFDKFLMSVSMSRFGYNLDTHYLFRDHYLRWSPSIAFRVDPNENNRKVSQWWKYRYVHIDQHYGRGTNYPNKIFVEEKRSYGIHELLYQLFSDQPLTPFKAAANLQAGKGFVRMNLMYNQHFVGKNKQRGIWVNGYAGWLPVYDQPMANVLFTFNGISSNGFFSRDYMYDEWLGGRNSESGIYSHQVFIKDAGLKTLSTIGISDKWMIGGGVSAAMPFKVLHFYMDAAVYPANITGQTAISFSGGAAIVLLKDVFEIYIPFLESKDIRESLSYVVRDRWFERISFQANFKLGNPLNLIDHKLLGF